jgi:hypothetical protein
MYSDGNPDFVVKTTPITIADIKSGRDFYDQSSEKVGDYFVAGM